MAKDTQPVEITTMNASLSKDFDSIDVGKMSKGGASAETSFTATGTTSEIDCRGFNCVKLHVRISGTGTWTVSIQDSTVSGGTFIDSYDGTTKHEVTGITSSRSILFRGVSDYIKVTATETADGATCYVKVQPLNL